MTRTITGVFHRDRVRKPRSRNWARDFAALLLEDSGRLQTRYYPDNVYLVENPSEKTPQKQVWAISSRAAAPLKDVDDLDHITVSARVKPWDNGHGGDLTHVKLVVANAQI